MPSHHVPVSMMKKFRGALARCPPRKTRVNIAIHSHVHVMTPRRVAKPKRRRPGFAARMRQENSRIEIALPNE